MSFSIQTNLNSMIAQENLRVNCDFQSRTINRLTSGYRINQSGDDAAGLAIANKYRSDVSELTQGVRNANDGISTLQIVDGGMNNISKMLDRLKTLATQSASGTFSGDRTVLNNEFRTLLDEIDRQAKGIGLDQNGQFARSLSVFIGGGRTHTGAVDIDNGTVDFDLSSATVDTSSLGLKGYQAVGGTADIGTGSATHSVALIVDEAANQTGSGYTDFYFSGPGFAGGEKIKVSVLLQNVSDTETLVEALNAAIEQAGGAGTQASGLFKNANIRASVHTGAGNTQQIAFSSSTTAFQVEAGDKMANALMGNFKTGAEGADLASTVTASAPSAAGTETFGAAGAGTIRLQFQGAGLTEPRVIALNVTAATTVAAAIADLQTQVAADATLSAAGISLTTNTGTLQFSNARGERFSVETSGDVRNLLGMGSFQAGSAGEFDYVSLDGAPLSANAAGSATLEFSINGGASTATAVTVDLGGGDAQAAQLAGVTVGAGATLAIDATNNQLSLVVDGNYHTVSLSVNSISTLNDIANQINTALGADGTASVVANQLVIESAVKGRAGSIQVLAGSANTVLGLTASNTATLGANRSGADIAAYLSQQFNTHADLQAADLEASFTGGALRIRSNNGTYFRVNGRASSAEAGVEGTATYAAATAGTLTGGAAGPAFNVTAATNDTFTVTIDGGVAQSITLSAGSNRTAAAVAAEINAQLNGAEVSYVGGAFRITSNSTGAASTVLIGAGNANGLLGFTGGASDGGSAAGTGFNIGAGNNTLSLTVGGTTAAVTLTTGANQTVQDIADDINADVVLGTLVHASDDNGHLKIVSLATGSAVSVTVNASSAAATLGLTTGVAHTGTDGNVGYGVWGATYGGNTAAAALSCMVNAGGVSALELDFAPLQYGSDDQVVSITANDSSGGMHALSVTLRNDLTARTGRSIDATVDAINAALRQSNDSTLQQIVAVKSNHGGTETIQFLSSTGSFRVSLGSTANAGGLNHGGAYDTLTSDQLAGGATIDISTQPGATAAVTALTTAVAVLGQAQAAVGKAQNQLTYALGLAESQISNFSAAESRIRDADVAAEAANLTKAQVLQQASIAAMAQANTAPQVVLSLLKG